MQKYVQYFKWEKVDMWDSINKKNKIYWEKVLQGNALFHSFGVDYEELEFGIGNYSTAIVELDDGSILNIKVDLIKFLG